MRNRTSIRRVSLLVLTSFTMSLCAPIVEAQTAQPTGGGIAGAVATAKNSLASLWNVWAKRPIPPGVAVDHKPTLGQAFSFFTAKGATPQQAEILANNAQASGQLATTPPPASSAPLSWIKKLFGGGTSTQTVAPAAETGELAASPAGSGIVDKIKNGFGKVVLGGKRTADTVVTGAQTAAFTIADKIDMNKYYQLPLSDQSAIKFRGQWESQVKFTDGKWVVDSIKSSSDWPAGAIKSGNAVGRLEDIMVGTQDGKITQGSLATGVDKIKQGATSLRDRIFGSKSETLSADQAKALGKLEIQGQLMEQSRSIIDAQKAIESRISQLTAKAETLQKPIPTEEIANLKKGYQTLENQKQEISKRLNKVGESPATTVIKDAASWALYSVGITAGINVIQQVVSGEKVDIKKAFSFVTQPSFWSGTAGGFLGSMLFTTLASSFLPPGMGIFFKVLPGFLGAAMGYQIGGGLFGGAKTNWIQTIGSTIASAGGYTLAYSMLGGAGAPGFALIGASIAAGAVASFLLGKLFNNAQPTAEAAGTADLPPTGSASADLPAPPVALGAPAVQKLETPAASDTTPNLDAAAAAQEMKAAYNEYINNLKERKVADARVAYDRYVKAKESLDKSRTASAN